jgi:5-amino-6-(5-phosphoribosylamino)uracil reductase
MADYCKNRPYTTVVLAMSADGKISDVQRSPARFTTAADKVHLEQQIADSDGVLFGAGTLRAYGTTLRVSHPSLLYQRSQQKLPPQPIQIVASRTANIDPQLRFFRQPVPRWLLTTVAGAKHWAGCSEFAQILVYEMPDSLGIDWVAALQQMASLGLSRLAVLGGGQLVASLVAADLVDELWLTVCPLILGGATAPTPVEGEGFYPALAPRLELLSVQAIEQEVFLHYRRQRPED